MARGRRPTQVIRDSEEEMGDSGQEAATESERQEGEDDGQQTDDPHQVEGEDDEDEDEGEDDVCDDDDEDPAVVQARQLLAQAQAGLAEAKARRRSQGAAAAAAGGDDVKVVEQTPSPAAATAAPGPSAAAKSKPRKGTQRAAAAAQKPHVPAAAAAAGGSSMTTGKGAATLATMATQDPQDPATLLKDPAHQAAAADDPSGAWAQKRVNQLSADMAKSASDLSLFKGMLDEVNTLTSYLEALRALKVDDAQLPALTDEDLEAMELDDVDWLEVGGKKALMYRKGKKTGRRLPNLPEVVNGLMGVLDAMLDKKKRAYYFRTSKLAPFRVGEDMIEVEQLDDFYQLHHESMKGKMTRIALNCFEMFVADMLARSELGAQDLARITRDYIIDEMYEFKGKTAVLVPEDKRRGYLKLVADGLGADLAALEAEEPLEADGGSETPAPEDDDAAAAAAGPSTQQRSSTQTTRKRGADAPGEQASVAKKKKREK